MTRILIVVILVLINGFFAMSEMAVMTSRRSRLKAMAQTSRGAARALALSEHPEKFLSAVQLWITILSLLTGYFGGESVATELEGPISRITILAPYSHAIGFAIELSPVRDHLRVVGEKVVVADVVPELRSRRRDPALSGDRHGSPHREQAGQDGCEDQSSHSGRR